VQSLARQAEVLAHIELLGQGIWRKATALEQDDLRPAFSQFNRKSNTRGASADNADVPKYLIALIYLPRVDYHDGCPFHHVR
jgi:hypothetical protein